MKDFLRNNKKEIIWFFIIFVIVVPFLIHCVFKLQTPIAFFIAEWSAGDVLGFYGVLLASGLAVYGVFLSIQYAQGNYQIDMRNRVLPYIAVETYKVKSKSSLFLDESENKQETNDEFYAEFKLNDIFFVIDKGKVEAKIDLTKEQRLVLQQAGFKNFNEGNGVISTKDIDLVNIPLEIKNVGNGAAIHLRIGLNPKHEEHKYVYPMQLLTGETKIIHIYAENYPYPNLGEYDLEFYYEDIIGTKYRQSYLFITDETIIEGTKRIVASLNLSGKQEKYTEDKFNG